MRALDPGFWLNRRVMVTGHTGFKGSYLCYWLAEMGADVVGYALPPVMSRPLYEALAIDDQVESIIANINDLAYLEAVVASREPEIIFHLAADALVLDCLRDPIKAFSANLMGTVNLLQAARRSQDLRAVVAVTTDKCYRPTSDPCREDDALGGDEPYSASKAAAEMAVQAFRHCYLQEIDGVGVATARAGNVIGAGDFSANRLIPDLVRGARAGQSVPIRHPEAVRPWQHVLDALFGYLLLAERLSNDPGEFSRAWNFGPSREGEWSVRQIADIACRELGSSWQHVPRVESVENPVLRLDSSASRHALGWQPRLDTHKALNWTIDGYKALLRDGDDRWLLRQLQTFEAGLLSPRTARANTQPLAEAEHDQA